MNKKKIDKLIFLSYSNNSLNQKKVKKISSLLNKSDLKKYVNGLKLQEKKRNIIVLSPYNISNLSMFQKLFPDKKIIFKKDPGLMLGIEIINNDIIYQFTLQNSLSKIVSHVEQNYD